MNRQIAKLRELCTPHVLTMALRVREGLRELEVHADQ